MPHIRTFLFDMGGVLVDLTPERCLASFRRLGFPQMEQMIDPYYPAAIFNDLERGTITAAQMCDYVRREAGRPIEDEAIYAAYNDFIGPIPGYKLDLLLALRRRGYRVLMLSNTNEIVFPAICERQFRSQGRTIDDYFDAVYLSYRMKRLKPDAHIFRDVLAAEGIRAEETLFVDDSPRNIEAARTLGFATYEAGPGEDFRPFFRPFLRE